MVRTGREFVWGRPAAAAMVIWVLHVTLWSILAVGSRGFGSPVLPFSQGRRGNPQNLHSRRGRHLSQYRLHDESLHACCWRHAGSGSRLSPVICCPAVRHGLLSGGAGGQLPHSEGERRCERLPAPPSPSAPPAPAAPPPMTVARRPAADLVWSAPAAWKPKAVSSMRRGSFEVGEGTGPLADLAITVFPGDVGGDLANVNRWRGQLDLPPIAEADLACGPPARDCWRTGHAGGRPDRRAQGQSAAHAERDRTLRRCHVVFQTHRPRRDRRRRKTALPRVSRHRSSGSD